MLRHRTARRYRGEVRAPRKARSRYDQAPGRRRAFRPNRRRIHGLMDVSWLYLCSCDWLGGTDLSRFRAPAFPGLFCKAGFAASMPWACFRAPERRIYAVNVKLTMRVGLGAGLLASTRSTPRLHVNSAAREV